MDFDEQSLRKLLTSRVGPVKGQTLLKSVEAGEPLVITMADSIVRTFTTVEEVRGLLAKFGWGPSQ